MSEFLDALLKDMTTTDTLLILDCEGGNNAMVPWQHVLLHRYCFKACCLRQQSGRLSTSSGCCSGARFCLQVHGSLTLRSLKLKVVFVANGISARKSAGGGESRGAFYMRYGNRAGIADAGQGTKFFGPKVLYKAERHGT